MCHIMRIMPGRARRLVSIDAGDAIKAWSVITTQTVTDPFTRLFESSKFVKSDKKVCTIKDDKIFYFQVYKELFVWKFALGRHDNMHISWFLGCYLMEHTSFQL